TCDPRDGGYPSDNDNTRDDGQANTYDPAVTRQRTISATSGVNDLGGDLIRLENVSCTHDGNHHACSKAKAQNFPKLWSTNSFQPVPKIIHRPTRDCPVFMEDAKLLGERCF